MHQKLFRNSFEGCLQTLKLKANKDCKYWKVPLFLMTSLLMAAAFMKPGLSVCIFLSLY